MSHVHNFIVLAQVPSTDDEPPRDDLPSPWIRIDESIVGDGKGMEGRVWARVSNGLPTAAQVAAELRAHPWDEPDGVMLIVKEQDDPSWRIVDWRDPEAE